MNLLRQWWKWYWRQSRLNKVIVIGVLATVAPALPAGWNWIYETFFVDKRVKLRFEPQVTFREFPPNAPQYDIRFVVRNAGKNTANSFNYTFIFPEDTAQRFGLGDRSLWKGIPDWVSINGKNVYKVGGTQTSQLFKEHSVNLGNMSFKVPLENFTVGWQLFWDGGSFPEDLKTFGTMRMENGVLKVEPH